MPVVSRFFFALTCFIMIIFDGVFAADVDRTRRLLPPRSPSPKADETQPGQTNLVAAPTTPSDNSTINAIEESASGVDSALKDRSPPKPKSVPPPAPGETKEPLIDAVAIAGESFAPRERGALLLLSLLQREGRFVDFLQQDVTSFDDSQVGAAARVVHDGCRRALKGHLTVEPIRAEAEGEKTTLAAGYDVQAIKLVGNVSGKPPYKGSVQHRGWRAASIELPQEVGAHDPSVLAQAEIEL
jgi:hypothetical protein